MFDAHFDRRRGRLCVRYSGFWSERDVMAALARFRTEIASASKFGTFTLLEDFRGFAVQQASVMAVGQQFVDTVDAAPIARDAMIVDSALLRVQMRRQPGTRTPYAIFATAEEAESWLAEVEPVA